MSTPSRFWIDLSTRDFAQLDTARTIAVLPVAATEQHGPHLPVSVDTDLVDGVVAATLPHLPAELPVLFLPTQAVGLSPEHQRFPGTLTLSSHTVISLWTEIGESVARAGVRKLVLFNAHGGQPQIMDIVARDLRVRLNMLAVSASWYGFGLPDGLFPPEEVRFGIHGGAVETSMMLHLRPDLVRRDKLRNFVSEAVKMAREFKLLRPTGPVAFAWQTQDLNPEGACGDATNSDAARGAKVIDFAAAKFVELLQDIDRFPLTALRMR